MADSLEISLDGSNLTLLLDRQEIKDIQGLKLERESHSPPLLTMKVWITGPVLCRVSGKDPKAQEIRLGMANVLKDWTPAMHGTDEGTPD